MALSASEWPKFSNPPLFIPIPPWWVGLGWSWWPRALVLLGLGSLGRSMVVVRSVVGSVGRSVRWLVVVGLFLVHVPHPDSYFLSVHARPWARTSLRCCDTEIDRHPHVVGSSGIFTDVKLPPQGAGHLAVIILLRVRYPGYSSHSPTICSLRIRP